MELVRVVVAAAIVYHWPWTNKRFDSGSKTVRLAQRLIKCGSGGRDDCRLESHTIWWVSGGRVRVGMVE